MDEAGSRLTSRRLPEGLEGIRGFHDLVAGVVDEPGEVVVGIETDLGLWVEPLVAAGYQVYGINPVAVSRYRDRHNLAGAKSDAGDAKVLADLVRTDRHNHRPLAGDSDLAEAVKVLARHICNRRLLAAAIDQWAFCSLTQSPGCRAFYDQRRTKGDLHHQALRALGNRLVGILHGCLRHGATYNEDTAWAHRQTPLETKAA